MTFLPVKSLSSVSPSPVRVITGKNAPDTGLQSSPKAVFFWWGRFERSQQTQGSDLALAGACVG